MVILTYKDVLEDYKNHKRLIKTKKNFYFKKEAIEHLLLGTAKGGVEGVPGIPDGAGMTGDEGPTLAGFPDAGHTGIQEGRAIAGGGVFGTKWFGCGRGCPAMLGCFTGPKTFLHIRNLFSF